MFSKEKNAIWLPNHFQSLLSPEPTFRFLNKLDYLILKLVEAFKKNQKNQRTEKLNDIKIQIFQLLNQLVYVVNLLLKRNFLNFNKTSNFVKLLL